MQWSIHLTLVVKADEVRNFLHWSEPCQSDFSTALWPFSIVSRQISLLPEFTDTKMGEIKLLEHFTFICVVAHPPPRSTKAV